MPSKLIHVVLVRLHVSRQEILPLPIYMQRVRASYALSLQTLQTSMVRRCYQEPLQAFQLIPRNFPALTPITGVVCKEQSGEKRAASASTPHHTRDPNKRPKSPVRSEFAHVPPRWNGGARARGYERWWPVRNRYKKNPFMCGVLCFSFGKAEGGEMLIERQRCTVDYAGG